jgi:hypothetical protein
MGVTYEELRDMADYRDIASYQALIEAVPGGNLVVPTHGKVIDSVEIVRAEGGAWVGARIWVSQEELAKWRGM